MATIRGKVIDSETDLTIPFVAVDLYKGDPRTGILVSEKHTDERGEFVFRDVEPGEYTIVVRSPIHNPVIHKLIIKPDQRVIELEIKTVKIHLR